MTQKVKNCKAGTISVQFNEADNEPAVVQIYEVIGEDPWTGKGFTAQDCADALADIPRSKPLDVRINSAGGDVWDGMAIKTLFDEWPARKTCSIDGMAASVASWLPMGFDEIRAPKHAQMFIHDAWGVVMGNAQDMSAMAAQLEKTSNQIAGIYARKTGMSVTQCRDMMRAQTLMTAEEAQAKGFIDKISGDDAVSNFSQKQIANMKTRLAMLNSLTASTGGAKPNQNKDTMNREKMIALLKNWGVKHAENATDDELFALIEKGKPEAEKKNKKTRNVKTATKTGETGEHGGDRGGSEHSDGGSSTDDEGVVDDEYRPDHPENEDEDEDAPRMEDEDTSTPLKTVPANRLEKLLNKLEKRERALRNASYEKRIRQAVEDDKIPASQMNDWIEIVSGSPTEKAAEKLLNKLEAFPSRPPGVAPVNVSIGETSSVEDLNRMVNKLTEPARYFSQNKAVPSNGDKELIANNAKQINRTLNSLKKFAPGQMGKTPEMIGPLRDMCEAAWNQQAQGFGIRSPQNANTMSTDMLRQVILSEALRAFKRQFSSVNFFAHTYQNVPLEGNDFVKVPYYPLDTTASTEFTYSSGYVITPNAQTLSKSILVGGVGSGVATAGSGRKYKGLQFSGYEIRRQPWLNIAQLTVMAGEQLAIDVRADIIGTQISKTNFGSAIFSGLAGAFDHTTVANVFQQAAILAFWPMQGRNIVLAPQYYTALASDNAVSQFLSIGTTEILRQGIIGGLYSFENIIYDALLPVSTFIRGGDGANTAGADLNLIGYMCYPSAVLVATAPIMPPPGVLKKLVSYEQVTDDQTGLSISYQYFGLELNNVDNEIIECTYGSGLGEVAALKRAVSVGT